MNKRKQDLIQFLKWMRNGISFLSTWFLILMLIFCTITDVKSIPTIILIKMLVWISGGVLIFNLIFTNVLINKWSFIQRLSVFMILISFYQCVGFYWFDFFTGTENIFQWLIYIAIVLVLYTISILIYHKISQKQGELYTDALKKYQQKRIVER